MTEHGSIAFDRERVVVVDKASGPTSEDIARELGRRLVHRIDRLTSGLLVLADDARTVARMQRALREGRVEREYRFVVHGALSPRRLTSSLVRDRGDGLRGSGAGGKESVADIVACDVVTRGVGANGVGRHDVNESALPFTIGVARLVSGRTHQLRIQLAEAGHPIVGDPVYVRDARHAGRSLFLSPRLLLHAERLSFAHPNTHDVVDVRSPLPREFARESVAALELEPRSGRLPRSTAPDAASREERRTHDARGAS